MPTAMTAAAKWPRLEVLQVPCCCGPPVNTGLTAMLVNWHTAGLQQHPAWVGARHHSPRVAPSSVQSRVPDVEQTPLLPHVLHDLIITLWGRGSGISWAPHRAPKPTCSCRQARCPRAALKGSAGEGTRLGRAPSAGQPGRRVREGACLRWLPSMGAQCVYSCRGCMNGSQQAVQRVQLRPGGGVGGHHRATSGATDWPRVMGT
jgi:hypothetical protein